MKKQRGITLIALAITIIILLILAGITIVQLTGSGLFRKTKLAEKITRYENAKEIINMKLMEIQVDCERNGKVYNIKEIAEGMKQAGEITIEKYYNKEMASIKDGVTENIINLEGIVVSADEYPEYKFLIGEECQITGILEGEVTDTTSKYNFTDIIEFEEKAFKDSNITSTDDIEFSYEKRRKNINEVQLLIIIKDNKNGINEIEYPNGDILKCGGKSQIAIDYTIEYEVECIFKITSNNGYIKEVPIYVGKEPIYIYNEGASRNEELTGGLEYGFYSGTNPSVGYGVNNTEEGCIEVKTWGTWHASGVWTKEEMDLNEYYTMKVEIYDTEITYNSGYNGFGVNYRKTGYSRL